MLIRWPEFHYMINTFVRVLLHGTGPGHVIWGVKVPFISICLT